MLVKILAVVGAIAFSLAVFFGLGGWAAWQESQRWEHIDVEPCDAWQTVNSPFSPTDTCHVFRVTAAIWQQQHGGHPLEELHGVRVTWEPASLPDGKRGWVDEFGRKVAGTGIGKNVKVAFLENDQPCKTALRHELWHVLLRLLVQPDGDPGHERPEWREVVNTGCR